MFDSDDTHISDKSFKSLDRFEFCKGAEKEINSDMPSARGLTMSTSVF